MTIKLLFLLATNASRLVMMAHTLLLEPVNIQDLTHHMGLYFAKSRGAELVNKVTLTKAT